MKTDELRKIFLDFFLSKSHRIFPSASLVPEDDPTVLFTTAGMNQFKQQFLGRITDFRRAASCQKCLRTDDLDKVGKTPGHHTFFEMLGNFSFGDYFKEEAISWAWEFVTRVLKIPEERLWVSIYIDDQEAYEIWKKKIKLNKERIKKFGQKENFWPSNVITDGPNGPCGPCSEIFFDQGENVGCGKRDCSLSCNCGRFVEVWNLVFTQFNRLEDKDGKGYLEPLPQKNIDTGMGLERISAVMQGVLTNFEIDIFKPIVKEIEKEIRDSKFEIRNLINAIADHIRAIVFAIGDGVLPANEERGYVVRKLVRRAVWHGHCLGIDKEFLYKIVPVVTKVMSSAYPELEERRENISQIVLAEERRFQATLQEGLNILDRLIRELRRKNTNLISGKEAFVLYDTYGFPFELTQMIVEKEGFRVDKEEFENLMDKQRKRSQEKSKLRKEIFVLNRAILSEEIRVKKLVPTRFLGYEKFETITKVLGILREKKIVEEAGEGEEVGIILEETPFYPESGGQVADTGTIEKRDTLLRIEKTLSEEDFFIHYGEVVSGKIKVNDEVKAKVDKERRLDIMRNHTATHLLQSALREILGKHIQQAGSLVEAERFRFDFTHFKAIDEEQLLRIESKVNEFIRRNDKLNFETMSLEEAKKKGALAFFGEKYKEKVRVVSIGDYSKELCGGTHLNSTGEIGLFIITGESSIAQGVRRIEAITGRHAYQKMRELFLIVKSVSLNYKIREEKIPEFINNLVERIKNQEKELRNLKIKIFEHLEADNLIKEAKEIEGLKIIFKKFSEPLDLLRQYIDVLKNKVQDKLCIIFSSDYEGKASFLIGVTKNASDVLNAKDLVEKISLLIGGSGGGRPDLAQAGARDVEKLKLTNWDNISKIIKETKK